MDTGQNLGHRPPAGLIGTSAPMVRLRQQIAMFAARDSTVLIQGESGTGKLLVARAIHDESRRRGGPFIRVNCGAIPDGLWESEMFGHEHGAFTGAARRHIGKFEQANRGTLFLDEIGEMNLAFQAKLLCALESGSIDMLGGSAPRPVNIRVVAATNRDLKKALEAGLFREDFYYRINVLAIKAPALRDRREDIPLLARHFALEFGQSGVSEDAVNVLSGYDWPGNVRELRNVIERAVAVASSGIVEADHLCPDVRDTVRLERTLHEILGDRKNSAYEAALVRNNGNCQRAARDLSVHPNSLYRYKKKMLAAD